MEIRIRCAICDKPVDRITLSRDVAFMRTLIAVECHGDRDAMDIPETFFQHKEDVDALKASEGVAFATKRLVAA
jgi:hypothetical protein